MIQINLSDYWRFLHENSSYLAREYPRNISSVMAQYPSYRLVNGRDFGRGIMLSEEDALLFKLRYL